MHRNDPIFAKKPAPQVNPLVVCQDNSYFPTIVFDQHGVALEEKEKENTDLSCL